MTTAYLSIATEGNKWFEPQTGDDVALFTTHPMGCVLIGGSCNAGLPAALTIGATDIDVQGVANAALVKSYGLTLTMPAGVTDSNDFNDLLAGANNPDSNPYVWASNEIASAQATRDAALEMATYASNAIHGLSNESALIDSVHWSSNQLADLGGVSDQATVALQESDYASNTSIVALRKAELASNAGYTALSTALSNSLSIAQDLGTVTGTVDFSSNTAALALEAAVHTSNLAFAYLPSAWTTAEWASNTALAGLTDATYASNEITGIRADFQVVSDKATSAYITATTTVGITAWASNMASVASKDALQAIAAVNALSSSTSGGGGGSYAIDGDAVIYASNTAYQANSNTVASWTNIHDMSNVVYPNQARSIYGSNMGRAALSAAQAASNTANLAWGAAFGAESNADAALALAVDGISSSHGGTLNGTLDFSVSSAGSIIGLDTLGVGTNDPLYPVHVDSMATEENVSIWVSGSIQQLSDVRDKFNLERIENALEKVNAIKGYTFNYRNFGRRSAGVLAQEVLEVLPEAVHSHAETSNLSVSYNSLIPLMLEAIHDLSAIVMSLKR